MVPTIRLRGESGTEVKIRALFGKLRVMMIHRFKDKAIPENIFYDCPIKDSDKPKTEEAYDITFEDVYHHYEDYGTKDLLDYLFDEYS